MKTMYSSHPVKWSLTQYDRFGVRTLFTVNLNPLKWSLSEMIVSGSGMIVPESELKNQNDTSLVGKRPVNNLLKNEETLELSLQL